ncbi:class I SAM-dependent methyltransferase [Paenibacillus thalictri]|nr:class I SAM-dependent methyltransferase [Paenibacillus thalictri]
MENKGKLQQAQYADPGKFNARIYLHRKFSTNPYPWPCWVFDQFMKKEQASVLELGGGNGLLWTVNAQRIPALWDITVTDLSAGMLEDAKSNLQSASDRFRFEAMDAGNIPYPDGAFDIVIANHMLYHVGDRGRALAEIRRVLKPGGVFYASTVGSRNMMEMKEWVQDFNPESNYTDALGSIENRFSLDNGQEQLSPFFEQVQLRLYEDSLLVTEPEAIVNYVLSLNGLVSERLVMDPRLADRFKEYIEEKMTLSGGKLHIQKSSGMFVSM